VKRTVRLFDDHFTTYQDVTGDPGDKRDYPIGPDAQVRVLGRGGGGRGRG
jgi:hypothetical protein